MPPATRESTPVDDKVPVEDVLLLADLPIVIIKGVITMMKQLTLAALLGVSAAIAVPVIADPALQEAVVEENPSFKDRITGVIDAAKDKTSTLFNRDEKLQMYREQVKQLEQELANARGELKMHRIDIGVEHQQITMCADDVAAYLKKLSVSGGE